MKIGRRVLRSEFTHVEGDVKIEGIRPVSGDLDIAGSLPEPLQGRCQLEGHLRLMGTHEHHDLEVVPVERRE